MDSATKAVIESALISAPELALLTDYLAHELFSERREIKITGVARKSGREFDLEITGSVSEISLFGGTDEFVFTQWLPLSIIRATNWRQYDYLSRYPELTASGNWDGIKDSGVEAKWDMFETARGLVTAWAERARAAEIAAA